MRLRWIGVLCAALLMVQCSGAEDVTLKDQKDKISYSIGLNIGKGLKKQAIDVNTEALTQGIRDAIGDGKMLLTEAEAQEVLDAFQKEYMEKQQGQVKQMGEKNKKDGELFLAENKKKDGVVALPSGLQYKVIKAGTGPKPKATDTVVTNYRGTLIDGTEFDSSASHGGPATFLVNGVIKGWTEALQLMEVGAKWQLFVPSALAYGDRGAGEVIGPNTTLVFDVELVGIK